MNRDVSILTPLILFLTITLAIVSLGWFFTLFSPIANQLLPEPWNQTYISIENWSEYTVSLFPVLALATILALIVGSFIGKKRRIW